LDPPVMQQDYENPKIVYQIPAPPTSCTRTYHKFCSFMIATRYCIWWMTIIIADSILMLRGEIDSSLSHECRSTADNICRSIEYFRQLKPVGPHQVKVALAMAFGVSSAQRRQQILHEVADLLDPQPLEAWCAELQFIFDTLTGVHAVGKDDGLESFVESPSAVPYGSKQG